jgi:hypothetical protein
LEHLLYFGVAAAIGQAWTLLEFTALYSMPAVTLGTRLWPLLGSCSFLYLFSQKGVCVFFFSNFVINEKKKKFAESISSYPFGLNWGQS